MAVNGIPKFEGQKSLSIHYKMMFHHLHQNTYVLHTFFSLTAEKMALLLLDYVTLTSLIPIIGLNLIFKKYLKNALDVSTRY